MIKYSITLVADEDFVLKAQWKLKVGLVATPVNISEYTATLSFYDANGAVLCDYTCDKEDEVGVITATIAAPELPALQTSARYKLKVSGPSNKVLLAGKVTWQP